MSKQNFVFADSMRRVRPGCLMNPKVAKLVFGEGGEKATGSVLSTILSEEIHVDKTSVCDFPQLPGLDYAIFDVEAKDRFHRPTRIQLHIISNGQNDEAYTNHFLAASMAAAINETKGENKYNLIVIVTDKDFLGTGSVVIGGKCVVKNSPNKDFVESVVFCVENALRKNDARYDDFQDAFNEIHQA